MIEFQVKSRLTGSVRFTAEIDCDEHASHSIKLGLAVRWALRNGTNLSCSDLSYTNLSGTNLSYTNLSYSDLSYSDLSYTDLRGTDLSGTNLRGTDLSYSDLSYTNLRGTDLSGTHGINEYVKSLHLEEWPVTYTATHMQIGCEQHALDEWREFDDARIVEMDGKRALKFWRKFKDHIFATIEMSPAKPKKEEPT